MVNKDYYNPMISTNFSIHKEWENSTLRPSIGMMIEFLTFDKPHGHLIICTELKETAEHGWRVIIGGKNEKDFFLAKEVHELCDALFQGLKYILEKTEKI